MKIRFGQRSGCERMNTMTTSRTQIVGPGEVECKRAEQGEADMKLQFGPRSGYVKTFSDVVGGAGRSQNRGADYTKEGDVHEEVGSVRYAT